ncbi:Phage-related tail protein [uncultured Candidatus Thioglobus sp.]|nr:Phage-related tail protein [uncultured Candidatus Thioglobus sp.]
MKKIIYKLLVLVVVLLLAAVFFIDSIGKDYAKKYIQNLLKTPVEISQFESSIFDKSLNIDFINVRNPPNFHNKNAFSLDHFFLKIGTIDDALIIIDKIELDGLKFTLEQNSNQVNLTQLLDNLKKQDEKGGSAAAKAQENLEQRIKIKHLKVGNIHLKIDTKWLNSTLKVPDISVHNFGGNSGILVDEIGSEVVKEILNNLRKTLEEQGIDAGKKEIEASLRRKIEQQLGIDSNKFKDELKNKAKDLFKNLGF